MNKNTKKILFLEEEAYYKNLGLIIKENYVFEGMKFYKKKDLVEYDLIVSLLYNNPLCNYIIIKAKKYKIPTLLVADGIYEFANCYMNQELKKYKLKLFDPIYHDLFVCVGRNEKTMFENEFVKTFQYLPKQILNSRKILEKPKEKCVLITTANTAYFNELEKKELIEILKKIIEELDTLEINYIFRIFDKELQKRLNIQKDKNFIKGSFENILEKVSSVITTPSSIVITAMFHQRGVAQLIYRDTPLQIQTGWNIFKTVNIKKTLISLNGEVEERILFQNRVLKTYLSEKNLNEIIEGILSKEQIKKNVKFEIQNEKNLLDSIFNYNIEYFIRKIYKKLKKFSFIKKLKGSLK